MAYTSASSIQKRFKYDVFLSFRGEDTRKSFVDHLYHCLKQKCIITYKDDKEIKKGERIGDELTRSIEDSRFYIIVFSKTYASSSWCLDELVKIMECQKMKEHTAYPVFYDVEPTEVRKQSGAVGEAFIENKEKEAAGRWRDALKEAAGLAGWELKNTFDGHEAQFINKIVQEISLELRFINRSVDEKLVGMETRVKDVVSSLKIGIEDVRMIGIWGMGGAGKTTLARAVFDQISFRFEGSSFVGNVREISKNPSCGLKSLQKQVLSEVLRDPNITVTGVSDFKRMMSGRKVLLVLDDVDQLDQLEELAGEDNWFKLGSRVIITTREKQVLVAHGLPKNLIVDVKLLLDEEANCLFNRYAFGRVIPNQGYEKLARQVVCYAACLPLTIKVLGADLRGKNKLEWTDKIERLKTIPEDETLKKLELSYNSLEEEHKEIFLDVACMLKGWEKEKAIIALESRGFYARSGLRVLEQKSLITISNSWDLSPYGELFINMHDHLEEMGKTIVRRSHPNEPCEHSRLWIKEETNDILVQEKGTEATRCIRVQMVDPLIVMKGLQKMKDLRFLDVIFEGKNSFESNDYDSDSNYICKGLLNYICIGLLNGLQCLGWNGYPFKCSLYLPEGLQYLRWYGYPFKSLPENFQANNLVGLEMRSSNINQLWKGEKEKESKKLRFINLCDCKLRSLDIGLIQNLERIDLVSCNNLVELRMPVENFKLRYLKLYGSALRTLDLERAHNLDTLEVRSDYLTELHMPAEGQKLKHVSLQCSRLKILNLTLTQNYLEKLDLQHEHLVELHMPGTLDIGQAQHLKRSNIEDNNDLVELHFPLEKLRRLRLQCFRMKTLNLTWTRNLVELDLVNCKELVELHMPIESPELETIKVSCSKLRTLALVETRNLKKLDLVDCVELVEIHMPNESPKLETINILCSKFRTFDLVDLHTERLRLQTIKVSCSRLRTLDLAGARNFKKLDLEFCFDLEELHMPIESPELETINVLLSKLRILDLAGAQNLKELDLEKCEDLVDLHMPIESSELRTIKVNCSKLRTLDLTKTRNLERLDVVCCEDLVELHMPTESPKLETIYILCFKLRTLDLAGTRNLKKLDLEYCNDLVELHMPIESPELETIKVSSSKLRTLDLAGTRNLKKLDLQKCKDLVYLHMPIESPELKIINVNCSKLRTLDLTETRNLERLDLVCCEDLVELHMPIESPKLKTINILCSKLETIKLGLSPHLESLDLRDCVNLVEIYAPVECGCVRFKPVLVNKGSPMVGSLSELHLIARSFGICTLHRGNNFPKFHFECIYKEPLPPSTRNLEKLISFRGCACTNLEGLSGSICSLQCLRKLTLEGDIQEVPKELGLLECLEELTLESTNVEHLPDSICTLKLLKVLQLKSCRFLKQLPEDLGRLECLEELQLMDCTSLRAIPNSICEMHRLKCFYLMNCILVEQLPKEIGRLPCLTCTLIKGTSIIDPPESLFQLKGLLRFFP